MSDYIQVRLMAWWYERVITFTHILDRLNKTNQPVFAAVNEGIRRMAKEAVAYSIEITPTEEMEAVTIYPVGDELTTVELSK